LTRRRTGEPPHHNTLTCYTDYRCRRPECIDRRRAWQRELQRKQRERQPVLIDAKPVLRHLIDLQAAGISINHVAHLAGLNEGTVRGFLPSPSGRRPRKHRVTPEIAAKILAVSIKQGQTLYRDGTGTRRRIQALVAAGWPMRRLAEHVGLHPSYIGDLIRRTAKNHPVQKATAEKITAAYERLQHENPTHHGIDARQVRHTRELSAAKRWPTPAYWAERMDVIDDPYFEPLYGVTRREIIAQDANWIMRTTGVNRATTAARLGISTDYIDHAFRDHPQYAVEVVAAN
jgi:hypothetical protein